MEPGVFLTYSVKQLQFIEQMYTTFFSDCHKIERLKQFDFISQKIRQHIREQGICSTTGEQIEAMLETAMKFLDFNMEACEYAGKLIDFVHEQSKIVPKGQLWIGSSEIIESLFGKLKSLEQDQSKGGFTSKTR